MSKDFTNNGTKGGVLIGKKHEDGGIKVIVKDAGINVEVEDKEGLLAKETLQSDKTYTIDGKKMKAVEVASYLNQDAGGKPIERTYADGGKITDKEAPVIVESGQAVITAKAMTDKKKHDFNGKKLTKIEILSIINQDAGGNELKLKTGGNIAYAEDNVKRNAYFIARAIFSNELAGKYPHKLFRISDLQPRRNLLLWCNSENKYCLFEITKIADNKIFAINFQNGKTVQFSFDRLLQNDVVYFSEKEILKKGGTVKKPMFSPTKELHREEIIVKPELFQGRQTEYSQKTVDKIVNEGFDKSANPIVVWWSEKDKKYIVISGHSRWEASERLYKQGDKSLETMPVKEFNGTKEEAIEFAVIKSNRGNDPESLLSDVIAFKLAVKNGWNKEQLLGYFAPESRINKLRDLSYLDPDGLFMEYLGKESETSFPYLERNARWVGIVRKSYPDKITDAHEKEIFNFFWKPKTGKPKYAISKQQFFHLMEKKVATLNFDKNQPLNIANIKLQKNAMQLDNKIAEIENTLQWLFSELTHNIEIKLQAEQNGNTELSAKKEEENKNILKSIEARVKQKSIYEKQINDALNQQTFDLFSQASSQEKESVNDETFIQLSKKFLR